MSKENDSLIEKMGDRACSFCHHVLPSGSSPPLPPGGRQPRHCACSPSRSLQKALLPTTSHSIAWVAGAPCLRGPLPPLCNTEASLHSALVGTGLGNSACLILSSQPGSLPCCSLKSLLPLASAPPILKKQILQFDACKLSPGRTKHTIQYVHPTMAISQGGIHLSVGSLCLTLRKEG